jgi:hypothetical protein
MKQLHSILKKLIRNSAGRTKFTVAVVGMSVAAFLLLTAVQIQVDYNQLLYSKSSKDSVANFLVINKVLTDANLGNTTLDDSIINDISKQPFTEAVGILTPSKFKASIQSNSSRFPFYTDIAFESVPAAFIDVNDATWTWNEQADFVPIIIPTMFLDMYNFQFSLSQNLPQLTPAIVKMIVLKVNIYGPNGTTSFNGKIVGFSDRISSMLVPQEFMQWGNKQFASDISGKSSRIIIRTKDPGNPLLSQYLEQHQLTTDSDKTRFSKYRKVVDAVVVISGATGTLMLIFALLVFSLFIQLTIASCKEEISLLILLGASPTQLKKFIMKQFFPANVWMISIALLAVTVLQYFIYQFLSNQHIVLPSIISGYTIGSALLLLGVLWWVNSTAIQQSIHPKRSKD